MIKKLMFWFKVLLTAVSFVSFIGLMTHLEQKRIAREKFEAKQEADRKQKESDELIRRCREEFKGKPILNRWLQFRGCTLP